MGRLRLPTSGQWDNRATSNEDWQPNKFCGDGHGLPTRKVCTGRKVEPSPFRRREIGIDLAGSLAASFEGSAFEDDGIDLSGIAGFEMVKLYQAVQYYDMVLTRFYSMGDVIGAALASGSPATARNFISSATVTSYFDRLIRASTQRSRAMSEIARRYQAFNRADLARKVTERAYTSTYLESVVLANLINRFKESVGGSQKPQIEAALSAKPEAISVWRTVSIRINSSSSSTIKRPIAQNMPVTARPGSSAITTRASNGTSNASSAKVISAKVAR